jgi:hypothetical protein
VLVALKPSAGQLAVVELRVAGDQHRYPQPCDAVQQLLVAAGVEVMATRRGGDGSCGDSRATLARGLRPAVGVLLVVGVRGATQRPQVLEHPFGVAALLGIR